jgi:hypothetical protein
MRKTHLLLGLWLTGLPLAALAAEADGGVSAVAGEAALRVAPDAKAVTAPAPTGALAALAALNAERDAFSQSFDWGSPAQLDERQRAFAQAMDAFDRRSLELKADWLLGEGRVDEAQAIQARLDRPAPERLADLPQDRDAVVAPAQEDSR